MNLSSWPKKTASPWMLIELPSCTCGALWFDRVLYLGVSWLSSAFLGVFFLIGVYDILWLSKYHTNHTYHIYHELSWIIMRSKYEFCNFKMVLLFTSHLRLPQTPISATGHDLWWRLWMQSWCDLIRLGTRERWKWLGTRWKWLEAGPQGPGPKTERTLPRLTWVYLNRQVG